MISLNYLIMNVFKLNDNNIMILMNDNCLSSMTYMKAYPKAAVNSNIRERN